MPFSESFHRQTLSHLFGSMQDDQVKQLLEQCQTLNLEAGDFVFKQGDIQNALYILLSGRLRAVLTSENGSQNLGDISIGEPVGEIALFTKEPRSASVVALRKSTVLVFDEDVYLKIAKAHPSFAYAMTQLIIDRMRQNARNNQKTGAIKNIAIVKQIHALDLNTWTEAVKKQLSEFSIKGNFHDYHDFAKSHSQVFFTDLESHDGLNFLFCDEEHYEWSQQCVAYCDLVLVVADFSASSEVSNFENALKLYEKGLLEKKVYLVLQHAENAQMPSNTSRWIKPRSLALHLHLRNNHQKDLRRLCRIISGTAVGLVLGGGGAKGFAHIGAAKAMMESGIDFDFVGGTSAGALYGMGLTLTDFDIPAISILSQKGAESKVTTGDYHLPFVSLMTGRKMRTLFKSMFEETYIEDFWINTFCISTNYSKAAMTVHEYGLARTQLEASIAIPGVFPPVIIDGHLHVDGGVMDNLPIQTMYQKPVGHVVAISLSSQAPHIVEIDAIPSAWDIFINKFTKKHRYRLPKMASLLINSLTLNSVKNQAIRKSEVSIYLEMDLRKFGFLDWSKWKQLIDKGYEETKRHIAEMPESEKFWKKSS